MPELYALMSNESNPKIVSLFDKMELAIAELNNLYQNRVVGKSDWWIDVFEKNETGAYVNSGKFIECEYK